MFYSNYNELGNPVIKTTPQPTSFGTRILSQGQSQNVEDRRVSNPSYAGNHRVQVFGYLTRNTWYHLASRVPYDIAYALQSQGFFVTGSSYSDRDRRNSQYNFKVDLRVPDGVTTQQLINGLLSTLARTVALPNSIRIINVFDYRN